MRFLRVNHVLSTKDNLNTLHDVYNNDLDIVSQMANVDLFWDYFKSNFLAICNKHAPFRIVRISGKNNPWSNKSISSFIRGRDPAWAKSKKTNNPLDWTLYRTLRNTFTKPMFYYMNQSS